VPALLRYRACSQRTLPWVFGANRTGRRAWFREREPRHSSLRDRISARIDRCYRQFSCISDLIPRFVTALLNSLLLQNIRNLQPPVSVEVSVREIRQIQLALSVSPNACEQISFNCRDFDFPFLLCSPVFTFLRVSFSRTRASVTKT
jgi:hypothetical protein